MMMNAYRPPVLMTLALAAGLLAACVSEQVIEANAPPVSTARESIAEHQLLDVGIVLFDPGLPRTGNNAQSPKLYPAVRMAEARYFPYTLKTTLEATAQWGAVRVVPHDSASVDLLINGRIVESNGSQLTLEIEAHDAGGHRWLRKQYSASASKYAYNDIHFSGKDPFQAVYNNIANDLLAAREKLADEAPAGLRTIAELRFAADLTPETFRDYLQEDPPGRYTVNRLPAQDDPMLQRIRRIRGRDALLLDTLDQHYAAFHRDMNPAYREWRRMNYEETVELKKLQRSARNRMGMGAAAVVAGVAGGIKSESSAGRAVSTATAVGGTAVFASGLKKHEQSQIHVDALHELNTSFEDDLQPRVIDIEGQTVTLTGSAQAQYDQWRVLLREIHTRETGLPAAEPSAQ